MFRDFESFQVWPNSDLVIRQLEAEGYTELNPEHVFRHWFESPDGYTTEYFCKDSIRDQFDRFLEAPTLDSAQISLSSKPKETFSEKLLLGAFWNNIPFNRRFGWPALHLDDAPNAIKYGYCRFLLDRLLELDALTYIAFDRAIPFSDNYVPETAPETWTSMLDDFAFYNAVVSPFIHDSWHTLLLSCLGDSPAFAEIGATAQPLMASLCLAMHFEKLNYQFEFEPKSESYTYYVCMAVALAISWHVESAVYIGEGTFPWFERDYKALNPLASESYLRSDVDSMVLACNFSERILETRAKATFDMSDRLVRVFDWLELHSANAMISWLRAVG